VSDLEHVASQTLEFRNLHHSIVDSVAIWFLVTFPDSDKTELSTAPGCDTHWNQELLLFDDPISNIIAESDMLEITISIRRNAYWRRHYVIDCSVRHVRNGEELKSFSKMFPHHRFPSE
jgi:hypothetical protein